MISSFKHCHRPSKIFQYLLSVTEVQSTMGKVSTLKTKCKDFTDYIILQRPLHSS